MHKYITGKKSEQGTKESNPPVTAKELIVTVVSPGDKVMAVRNNLKRDFQR